MAITGRTVAIMALGLVPVLVFPGLATVPAWVSLLALGVVVDLVLAVGRSGVRLDRGPVDPVRLHEPGDTSLTVVNQGRRRLRGVLRDAWQPSAGAEDDRHPLDVASGGESRVATTLRPVRRGDLLADRVTVRSVGPLGLAARQWSTPVPGSLRVLPAFPSRRHLPALLAHLRLLDGRSALRTRGSGTEFDSLRDYVPGDDVRSIDWRATARRSDLVVRTWRPERDRQIIVLLDTSRTSAGRIDDVPRLDAGMDAALLLAALAIRAGDRVDLVAGDRVVRHVSTGGSGAAGRDRLHHLIESMSGLEPALVEADWTAMAAKALGLARGRCLIVLVTPLEPVVVQESLLPALTALVASHRVVLASVQDPELERTASVLDEVDRSDGRSGGHEEPDVYDVAAAEFALAERARTTGVLSRLGVTVLDRGPNDLPRALSDAYLDLKARGLL